MVVPPPSIEITSVGAFLKVNLSLLLLHSPFTIIAIIYTQVMLCWIVSFFLTFNIKCKTPEEGGKTKVGQVCPLRPPWLALAKGNAVSAIEKSAFTSQFKKVPEWRHLWRKVCAGGINTG